MPKLIRGAGSLQQAEAALAEAGVKDLFLITGKHFNKTDAFAESAELKIVHFIKSKPNVEESEIEEAFEQFLKAKVRTIAAIGGGSVIDLAKAIIHKCIQSAGEAPFFMVAPTTTGSGSEATQFAVVYKGKTKLSLAHPSLLPQLVILDPQLTGSQSSYQIAVSGIDVLSQAIESLWNKNSTKESKEYATESIKLWNEYYLKAVAEKKPEALDNMQWAAHLAGKAINITRTTGPHALSYYLTAHHNIPHGQAVGLFLPVFFLYNKPGLDICSLINAKDPEQAKEIIQMKMKEAGLAISFSELGIEKNLILDDLLKEVNKERFSNNPVEFNPELLKELFSVYL
jgi:alcohol dehydrogenase class IV